MFCNTDCCTRHLLLGCYFKLFISCVYHKMKLAGASITPKPMMRIAYSPNFSQIYQFHPIFSFFFRFLASSLLWPWCIYASCLTCTGCPGSWLIKNIFISCISTCFFQLKLTSCLKYLLQQHSCLRPTRSLSIPGIDVTIWSGSTSE